MSDPVKKAAHFAIPRKPAPGKPVGLPDGWRWADWKDHVTKIKKEAQKMAEDLRAAGEIVDDDRAELAMATCIEILMKDGENRVRLQAAKTVLEYTKSKPAAKSEVTVGGAEDFLKSILNAKPKPDADRAS